MSGPVKKSQGEVFVSQSISTTLVAQSTEQSLWDRISSIFCCCCYKQNSIPQPQPRNSDDMAALGYISGKRYTIPPSSSQDTFTIDQSDLVYDQLNSLDFQAARRVVEAHKEELTEAQFKKLNDMLNEMEKECLFLNPHLLRQNVKNIPEVVFKEICENVCLVEIVGRDNLLKYTKTSKKSISLKDIKYLLNSKYVLNSNELFPCFVDRDPNSLEEQVAFIRWVMQKFEPKFKPEFIPNKDEDCTLILQEHKRPVLEIDPIAYNTNKEPILVILNEETIE